MNTVSANQVKELRERTGVGMMECKRALLENNGDVSQSIEWLRQRGILKAEAKQDRATSEGLVSSYIHGGGKIGVLLELQCETDFVARNDEFQNLSRDIAMHIAASAPKFISAEDIPAAILDVERGIILGSDDLQGKPDNIKEKMAEGRLKKFKESIALLDQPFVKDPKISVGSLISNAVAKLGENIRVARFERFVLGS